MPRKKNSVSTVIDSFVASVNRTGGGSSSLPALVFLGGGAFGIYVGYTSPSLLLMAGGSVTLLIGLMLMYKVWYDAIKKRRRSSNG